MSGERTSYYDILRVSQDAPIEVIKAAHKALIKKAHPDAGGSLKGAVRLNRALEVLSDPRLRADHDRDLAKWHAQSTSGRGAANAGKGAKRPFESGSPGNKRNTDDHASVKCQHCGANNRFSGALPDEAICEACWGELNQPKAQPASSHSRAVTTASSQPDEFDMVLNWLDRLYLKLS